MVSHFTVTPAYMRSQASDFSHGTTVLRGIKISVSSSVIQGTRVIQVAAFRGGAAVGVFNLTTTTAEKTKLLQDLYALAANPEAQFELTWVAISPTSGKLKLKLESSYSAAASKPTVSAHFPTRVSRLKCFCASIPIFANFSYASIVTR